MVASDILNADRDNVGNKYYNGRPTIRTKVRLAAESLSGVMIWELDRILSQNTHFLRLFIKNIQI